MTATVIETVIDAAIWLMDRARQEDVYLQPQKLQRLLYIAQGSYAAMHHGRKLMPAVFVAGELGPQDPNIMRLFERGRPSNLGAPVIRPEVERFMESIWARYGHHTTEYINDQIKFHAVYKTALKKGVGEEIPFAAIVRFFTQKERPKVEQVKTADGRTLQKWMPQPAAGPKTT